MARSDGGMYRVDVDNKRLVEIPAATFVEHELKERYDIQEWIAGSPRILGEDLLIIAKELTLPSGKRLDLLAIDREGSLVVIELKRDDSGSTVEWQAIKYASYCSAFSADEICDTCAEYRGTDAEEALTAIEEFIDTELDDLNSRQRIILVSKAFHPEVASAVLWLREGDIDIECVRLALHCDETGNLYIAPDIMIPLPEAKDYIQRKESRHREQRRGALSSFSLEKSDLPPEELGQRLAASLQRPSDLTPRLRVFLEVLMEEERAFGREEVKERLFESGIGKDVGQAGRYLSGISQFLTKKSNPHLRQAIEFETGGAMGEMKDNYRIVPEFRGAVESALARTAGAINPLGESQ